MIYKAAVTNFVNSRNIGTSILVKDYNTLNGAIRGAKALRLNNNAVVEVREYDASQTAIIAWDDPLVDTGKTVYQSGVL